MEYHGARQHPACIQKPRHDGSARSWREQDDDGPSALNFEIAIVSVQFAGTFDHYIGQKILNLAARKAPVQEVFHFPGGCIVHDVAALWRNDHEVVPIENF